MTYRIAVDGYYGATGEFDLSLELIDSPPNDDFDDALPIVGPLFEIVGNTVGATQEPCEPVHDDNYYDPSVWYSWTAPADGPVVVDTAGSDFPTVLGIYTGEALCNLSRVPVRRYTGPGVPAKRGFQATAGVTYRIAVDGQRARTGSFSMSVRQVPAPANDLLSAAEPLVGSSASATGENFGATLEAGEPTAGGSASVWYSWTAPASGTASLTFASADFSAAVTVYTGDAVGSLAEVARGSRYGPARFGAVAGTTYRIAVDADSPTPGGGFTLNLALVPPPANDDFADASDLTGETSAAGGTIAGATTDPGEPVHGYAGRTASVWYSWTAPSSGVAVVTLPTRDSYVTAFAYAGDALDSLALLAAGDYSSELRFAAVAGTTYRVAVAGEPSDDRGGFSISVDVRQPPPNDAFANATELSGDSDVRSGSNQEASKEPGEPVHYTSGARPCGTAGPLRAPGR
ncbi:MAG TPA: hypothetical protein VF520_04450 [Thermoleophilaceae bacterium]